MQETGKMEKTYKIEKQLLEKIDKIYLILPTLIQEKNEPATNNRNPEIIQYQYQGRKRNVTAYSAGIEH